MGRSAGPFKGVCTQMWQKAVASVSVLTSCSKCRGCQWWCLRPRCCPFVLHFVSVALSWGVPQVQKPEMQSASVMFASFSLSLTNARLWGQQGRDIIVGKTKRKCGQEHLLMPTHCSTLLFTALPFWPSSLSLPSFTLAFVQPSSLSPRQALVLGALMLPYRFYLMDDFKSKRWEGCFQENGWILQWCVCLMKPLSSHVNGWEKKHLKAYGVCVFT